MTSYPIHRTAPDPRVVELAVYTLHDPTRFAPRRGQVHAALRGHPGFDRSWALRQVDGDLFVDVVVWDDLATAKRAAARISADPALAWFVSAIAEVRLFGHFSVAVGTLAALADAVDAPAVEIAAYRPSDPTLHGPQHRLVHSSKLPGRPEVVGNVGLAGLAGAEDGLMVDVVGWSSAAALPTVQAELMADPELSAFFDPANAMSVFALFESAVDREESAP
jgi:hypothetical protein